MLAYILHADETTCQKRSGGWRWPRVTTQQRILRHIELEEACATRRECLFSLFPLPLITSYYGVGKSRRRRSGLAADVATFACSHSDESLQHSCAPARSSTVKRGALPTRAAAVRCRQPKSLRGHLSPSARFSQSSQKHHLSGFQWAGHVGNVSIG